MNEVIKKLEQMGCENMSETMERFVNDEEFYVSLLAESLNDECFDRLKIALESNNISEAFTCAHTLKGTIGNMGLTPLYEKIVDMVEPLREGKSDGLMPVYDEVIEIRNLFLKSIS